MGVTARKIGAAMVWSVLAKVSRVLLGLVSGVLVVRSLGDHDYGVLSFVRTILMFVTAIAGLGMGQAVLKFLPELRVHNARSDARRFIAQVLVVFAVVWVVLVAAAWFGRGFVEQLFGIEGAGVIVAAAVALFFFELFYQVFGQILNSSYDTMRLSVAAVVTHVLYIVALLVVLPLGWGVLGVIGAGAVANLVACAMLTDRLWLAVSFGDATTRHPVERGRLLRYALPFWVIGILNLVVWRQSETLLLAYFRTPAETGYFDLAYRLPQMILEFVPGTIWPLVMAGVSEAYAHDPGALAPAIDRYYRMLFLVCAPICVCGAVLGGRMVEVLFGSEMIAAAGPTQWFFVIFTLSFFGTPLSMALYVIEKTHVNLIVYIVLAVVNVGLDLVLIPRYGVYGAVAPVALVMFMAPFIYRAVLGRMVEGIRLPMRFIAKCFLASSPVLLLIPALRFIDSVVELVAAGLLAVILIAFAFKKLRVLGKEEIDLLASIPIPMSERFLRFMSS